MSYILGQEKPPLDELVVHYGVKGMRWGVRKDRSSSESDQPKKGMSKKKKAAIGVGAVAVGAAATALILGKQGKLPLKDISIRSIKSNNLTTEAGAKFVKKSADAGEFKRLMKQFEADLADAHASETSYMRKIVPDYNPRSDPYLPKSELKRLRG